MKAADVQSPKALERLGNRDAKGGGGTMVIVTASVTEESYLIGPYERSQPMS